MMTSGGAHRAAEPESSVLSATQSECESALRHREERKSLNNQAFTTQQHEALQTVNMHIGAIHMGLKHVANVFAGSSEVRYQKSQIPPTLSSLLGLPRVNVGADLMPPMIFLEERQFRFRGAIRWRRRQRVSWAKNIINRRVQ